MQKKVIALAVAGILAAPMAAQAGVEVYGKARLSFGSITNDDSASNHDKNKLAVSSHASRLGFKGAEDLGNGMKAVWQIERGIDFTDKTGPSGSDLSTRNTFAGLTGDFGTALLGTHDTPYKISTGSLDPFGDTFADYNAVIDSTQDARSANVVAYISPSMSGFTVAAAYVTDFVNDNLPDTTTTSATDKKKQPAISLAGMYSNGPLYAALAYQKVNETSATCSATKCEDIKGVKLGVGYKINQFNLGVVYEKVNASNSVDQKNAYISGVMDMGSGMNLKAAFGKKGNPTSMSNADAKFFALGVGKNMTANTELYALYTSIKDGVNATTAGVGAYGLGVGNQPIGAAGPVGGESKAAAFVVGINHNFSSM